MIVSSVSSGVAGCSAGGSPLAGYNRDMAYSTEISATLTATLARFTTLNRHQLAGHVANLDFWLSEVQHCTAVLNGYYRRFEAMKSAQVKHTQERHTIEYSLDDPCCTGAPASPPKTIPNTELELARRVLLDAAYQFLLRCYKCDFINADRLRSAADAIGTSIDVAELPQKRP